MAKMRLPRGSELNGRRSLESSSPKDTMRSSQPPVVWFAGVVQRPSEVAMRVGMLAHRCIGVPAYRRDGAGRDPR